MIQSTIIDAYSPLFLNYTLDFSKVGSKIMYIPRFKKEILMKLTSEAKEKFKNEPMLLRLESPFMIIGDIHGNIRDLLRIFSLNGSPATTNYLLLGDYVDRGDHSIEVITLLLALKLTYPNTFYMIRGNHEFAEVNTAYGFREQVYDDYDSELYFAFNDCFAYMPLAAIIDDQSFVVHGGIAPKMTNLEVINQISRPLESFTNGPYSELVTNLVWNDPIATHTQYEPSPRGFGRIFGFEAIREFNKANNIKNIIRAHQCVTNGVEKFRCDNVYTVFSSSNYCETPPNKAGIINYSPKSIIWSTYKPIQHLEKKKTVYKDFEVEEQKKPICARTTSLIRSGRSFYNKPRYSIPLRLSEKKSTLVCSSPAPNGLMSCRPKMTNSMRVQVDKTPRKVDIIGIPAPRVNSDTQISLIAKTNMM